MKRIIVILYALTALACAIALACVFYFSSRGGALNAYVGQLRKKGEKITFAELNASFVPSNNTSVAVLNNAVAKLGPAPAGPTTLGTMQFLDQDHARIAWRQPAPPWTGDHDQASWQNLRRRLNESSQALSELRHAMEQ